MLLLVLASCSVMVRLIVLGGDTDKAEAALETPARLCTEESVVWLVVGKRQMHLCTGCSCGFDATRSRTSFRLTGLTLTLCALAASVDSRYMDVHMCVYM